MLTKPELITRLVAHTHAGWTEEDRPMLQAYEERMLEQMLAAADRLPTGSAPDAESAADRTQHPRSGPQS